MNTILETVPATRRRRIRYIDQGLQKWLVVVVVLEVAAAAGAVGLLYWRLSGLIEDGLYRVHFAAASSMLPVVLHEGALILLSFLTVNLLALLLATVVWGRHVGAIVRDFSAVIEKTLRMDFSQDAPQAKRHEVLGLAAQWRAKERARLSEINAQIELLDALSAEGGAAESKRGVLSRLRELLR